MLINIVFISVLIVCFITDCIKQKIYNIVVLPSILIVLSLNIWFNGFDGFKLSSIGFIVGLFLLLIPYVLGGIGAGDVKLLAFIGAAKGAFFVLNAAIYMALIGGILSLAILIFNNQAIRFFKSIISWIISFFLHVPKKIEITDSAFSNKFPYGTAIVAGAIICLLFKGAWII